jgi:drug/metabolite transporter (DMT)-like permease
MVPGVIRLVALIGVLAISLSAIFVRLASVSPSTAAVFRGAYALPVLAAIWWFVRRRDHRRRFERLLAGGAGLFLALDLAMWHRAIGSIGAGLATVLANTQVVFVGLLAWALHHERPTRSALATIPVVFAGVVLISGMGRGDAYGSAPLAGALLGVGAGLAYSGYLLVFRAANRGLSHPAGPLLDATIGMTFGSLFGGALDHGLDLIPHFPAHAWLIALALVAQVGGWLLIGLALPRLPALETSVLLLVQPTCTMLWGFLIFDERLSSTQLAGAAIVLAGVAVLSLRGSVVAKTSKAIAELGR